MIQTPRKNISFVCYNVDGLSKDKFTLICDNVSPHYQVIIFVETFANNVNQYKLEGFKNYAKIRKRGLGAKRNSGGLLILIKNDIECFFTPLESTSNDIFWFRVSNLLTEGDVIVGVGYCSPTNSRAVLNNSFFFHLEENLYNHINKFPNDKVLLLGDFNARTGALSDTILNETDRGTSFICSEGAEFILESENIPPRVNSDKEVNGYGKNLINICKEFGLCLCNGRSGHDKNLGNFTCITHNGASVVDYVLASHSLFEGIHDFQVLPMADFSVHFPLCFNMEVINIDESFQSSCPNELTEHPTHDLEQRIRYIWNEQHADLFVTSLQQNMPSLEVLHPQSSDEIDTTLDAFYTIMDNCAKNMKHTSKSNTQRVQAPPRGDAPFFDPECVRAKIEVKKAHKELTEVLRQQNRVGGLSPMVDFFVNKFTIKKAAYKNLVKDKKHTYLQDQEALAKTLSETNEAFWEYYKKNNKANNSNRKNSQIQPNQWVDHTKELFAKPQNLELEAVNVAPKNTDSLDADITAEEISLQIDRLKNKKSPGPDGICSQMLKIGKQFLLMFLVCFFNCIIGVSYYPIKWTEALVFMLFKKGDSANVSNYRSISLLNILSKIFASILQNRLYKWCVNFGVLSENQFGFRPNRSTTDCLFIHNTLVQYHLAKKRRKLYVCYIDFSKAFDCISWDILWLKLESLGIPRDSRFFKVLKAIYKQVNSRIMTPWGLTPNIELFRGVRQGCILSPLLFALFIDDIGKWLEGEGLHEFSFADGCPLTHLLFADDLVLFSQSVVGLQRMINSMNNYCGKFNMKINADKTKIVVYRNGGKLGRKEVWHLNGRPIEVVSKFRYLGLLLSSSGVWTAAQTELATRAYKGLFCIKNFLYKTKMQNTKLILKLFDSCIVPILNYGSEIWGFHHGRDIDKLCDNFYKFAMKLPRHTNNIAARGELGRARAHFKRYTRIIKYWTKLINNPQDRPLFLQKAYQMQIKMDAEGKWVWVSDVRSLLCSLGFSYEWANQKVDNPKAFLVALKERILYLENVQFKNSILRSPRLQFYAHIKLELHLSNYWESALPFCMRREFCKLITSTHSLAIETGRRIDVPRNERLCMLCELGELEDEVHFILKCPAFRSLREKFIPHNFIVAPGWNAALSLFINPDHTEKLIKYCFYATMHRDKTLNPE